MPNSLNNQSPATTNQIKHERPSINKDFNIVDCYIANSINGGMIKPIAYAPIMPGEQHITNKIKLNLKMLTPKTPTYQALKCTLRTYFVPHSRVWTNSEKFISQKGGVTDTKIEELPNLKNMYLTHIPKVENSIIPITDTTFWRDSWVSTYFPRFQTGLQSLAQGTMKIPPYNALAIRGYKAIYNDYERNKEYDEPITEYKGNDFNYEELYPFVTTATASSTALGLANLTDKIINNKLITRGKRNNSYYTNYRTELLGQDEGVTDISQNNLPELVELQKRIAEYRSEATNSQKNDWTIMSELYGSKKLTEGKVQLLGTNTFNLNYQAVTQDTYNVNENITEEFQSLGVQGAYCYTETLQTLYNMVEFKEPGFIHVIMQVTADSIFETGFDRRMLNVKALDQYRPDLKTLKDDVLYEIEKCGTRIASNEDFTKITGYKRKFSEYFKLPNSISGDMSSMGYFEITQQPDIFGDVQAPIVNTQNRLLTQSSFQFFEMDDKTTNNSLLNKNIWQDYTDFAINGNLAIKQNENKFQNSNGEKILLTIGGQNQVFFLGKMEIATDMPIDNEIKNNFTKFGEL